VRAAHVVEMDVASFIAHLGRLGIAAIQLTAAETNADLDTLEQWLPSSSPPPVSIAHLTESLLRQGLWAR
jgi:hypothetical protein